MAGREGKRGECQTAFGFGLARNRRGPKRPPEPRPSGVHPKEDAVERRCGAYIG